MSRIRPQCLDANTTDRSEQADVLLREESDEEEDEEEDEGDRKEDARMKTQTTTTRSERALFCISG